jgi:hypothetical protein
MICKKLKLHSLGIPEAELKLYHKIRNPLNIFAVLT